MIGKEQKPSQEVFLEKEAGDVFTRAMFVQSISTRRWILLPTGTREVVRTKIQRFVLADGDLSFIFKSTLRRV